MLTKDDFVSHIESPKELEILYQQNTKEFTQLFSEIYTEFPDSIVLQTWNERLNYQPSEQADRAGKSINRPLLKALLIALITGTITMLCSEHLDIDLFDRNIVPFILFSLIIYFGIQNLRNKFIILGVITTIAGLTYFLNILPYDWSSDTVVLAEVHIPVFFWFIIGFAYVAPNWKNLTKRIDYLRFNGEFVMYTVILLISWSVLFLITMMLFELISFFDHVYWEEYFLIFGVAAIPAISTYIIENEFKFKFNITNILSKIFTPLFLIIETIFLIAIIFNQDNPFQDRDILMICNVLLFLTLALTIFAIIERPQTSTKKFLDYGTFGLTTVTWIINAITLSAILFRLVSYGFTPNRIAVLGINVLFFVHLTGILVNYIRYLINRTDLKSIQNWIVLYIPVYTIWVLFVAIGLPLIFNYQ